MSFDVREASANDGEPQELYWFMRGSEDWHFTTGAYPITLDLNTYEPLAGLKRQAIVRGRERGRSQFTLSMPRDCDVALQFLSVPKQSSLWLKILKVHEGETDYRVFYQGRVRAVSLKGNIATITFDDLMESIYKQGFRHKFQNQCNHFMFESNCTLSEEEFSHADQEILTVDGNVITVDNTEAAGAYISGQVVKSNGERRLVVNDTKAGSTHTLTLLQPFEGLEAGEIVVMVEGACRHTFDTCPADNKSNYGGYPLVPRKNPFRSVI
jgi:hypothetical protein